jgi:hypothetical protein
VIEILLGKERAIKSPKPEDRITMIEEIYHRYDDIGYLLKKALIEKTNIDDMFHIVKELYEKFYPK